MKQLFMVLSLFAVACGASPKSPTTPTPTPPIAPACERNNSAIITLKNDSATRSTHDVLLDGARIAVIAYGQEFETEIAAGVSHSLVSRVSNTSRNACSGNIVPIKCSRHLYTCTG